MEAKDVREWLETYAVDLGSGEWLITNSNMDNVAAKITQEAADDRADALEMQNATWHDIEDGHLARIEELEAENERLTVWVNDLQSGMYINCVYCGHRYGPDDEVPCTMAQALKEHVEQCPKHPMSALRAENERLRESSVTSAELQEFFEQLDLDEQLTEWVTARR